MYMPRQFEETRIDVMHALMTLHPLASLVTLGSDGLIANHIPLFIDPDGGQLGVLRGHVPRANPVWREFSATVDSIAIFQGPQCYISPSWYPGKQEHGKAVPTWNYAVVHAHGIPRVIDDPAWLLAHVTELSARHEAAQALPWKVSDAPSDYIEKLIGALVGIEIPISRLAGKWKVSQNRPAEDRAGVIATLASRPDDQSQAMATLIGQGAFGRD